MRDINSFGICDMFLWNSIYLRCDISPSVMIFIGMSRTPSPTMCELLFALNLLSLSNKFVILSGVKRSRNIPRHSDKNITTGTIEISIIPVVSNIISHAILRCGVFVICGNRKNASQLSNRIRSCMRYYERFCLTIAKRNTKSKENRIK